MRRRKYTYEFILSIINEHIETGAGSKVLNLFVFITIPPLQRPLSVMRCKT